jgi:hypothetical protein
MVAFRKRASRPVTQPSYQTLTRVMELAQPTTTADNPVQIVPLTQSTAEVRLGAGRAVTSIGRVGSANGRWFWQHRDGEQSSPVASNRADAAHALAHYHQEFKLRPEPTAPKRRLLFG